MSKSTSQLPTTPLPCQITPRMHILTLETPKMTSMSPTPSTVTLKMPPDVERVLYVEHTVV